MQDLKVYDGSGWQSLKGPPGPSAVSADAGNTLKLGGDGLHFTTAPPDSDSYVWCKSGDDISARYKAAAALTPNGLPLAADNRATLFVLPGFYEVAVFDRDFVDVYGLGQAPLRPAVIIQDSAVTVRGNDIRISGIGTTLNFGGVPTPGQVFINCSSGDTSWNGNAPGTYIQCQAGANSFGGGQFSTGATGVFIDCVAGNTSFGTRSASGTFIRCTGGLGSFASGYDASGVFIDCTGGNSSFGGGAVSRPGIASGRFLRCRAGTKSFGAGRNATSIGSSSGTFIDCEGGAESSFLSTISGSYTRCLFGPRSLTGSTITSSARFLWCSAPDGSFTADWRDSVEPGAILKHCIGDGYSEINYP